VLHKFLTAEVRFERQLSRLRAVIRTLSERITSIAFVVAVLAKQADAWRSGSTLQLQLHTVEATVVAVAKTQRDGEAP
jgi:hypothetical protein